MKRIFKLSILFFAFLGCEVGLIVGGEIKNPKRTIPRSILFSIGSVVILVYSQFYEDVLFHFGLKR